FPTRRSSDLSAASAWSPRPCSARSARTRAPAPSSCSSSTSAPAARARLFVGATEVAIAAPAAPTSRIRGAVAGKVAGMPKTHDCLIVGAGPAGLVAATYLARFHRDVVVVDAGNSRAQWIPTSHNCPRFPLGNRGQSLLQPLRAPAAQYGVEPVQGKVESLRRDGEGVFLASDGDGRVWRARCVVLATGVVDMMPVVEGGQPVLERAVESGVLRLCAVCDGYEASDEC